MNKKLIKILEQKKKISERIAFIKWRQTTLVIYEVIWNVFDENSEQILNAENLKRKLFGVKYRSQFFSLLLNAKVKNMPNLKKKKIAVI